MRVFNINVFSKARHLLVLFCLLLAGLGLVTIKQSWAQAVVTVGSSSTQTTDRLVFYISPEVNYELAQEAGKLTINFDKNIDFDFGTLAFTALPRVSKPVYRIEGDKSVVEVSLSGDVEVKDTRQASRLVIEVSTIVAPPKPQPEATSTTQANTTANETPAPTVDPTDVTQTQLAAINNASELQPKIQEPQAQSGAADTQNEPTIEQIRPSNLDPGEILKISMANGQNEQIITFSWRFPVGAAVFRRAGYLWVIFDEESFSDLVAVQPYLNDRLLSAEQARDVDQTLFRFQLKEGQGVTSERNDNEWIIRISDTQTDPVIPISLARQENIGDNFRIFVPLDNPGPHLRVFDPVVGDIIDVIPVFDGGMGAATERSFAQFQILQTAQGLVLNRTSDQVVVSRFSNGVAIGGVTNLAVSLSPLSTDLAIRLKGNDESLRPARLIDFEAWRLGELKDFNKNRLALFKSLSESEPANINDKRWDAARFYLGHGMATEGLAFLDLMAEQNPEIMVDPKYRAVRGVALYYLEEYDEAWRQLSARELDAEPSVFLWRSLVAQKQGRDEDALKLFERGRESIQNFGPNEANIFRVAVVEAALNTKQFDTANWQLSLLRRATLKPYQKADVDYLEGRLLEMMGDSSEAMNYFKQVNEFVNRRAAAYARYDMTISRFESGEITPDEAILEMERLRYSWRGDKFEQRLLHGLGKLYLEKKDYRFGLETLRQAVASFGDGPESKAMTQEMTTAYRNLFLEGGAADMPPVQALALYYDFRELTPLGAEGDQMIRQLADRLVSVDLLERAADLLDHQVRFRLTGAAQSIIATRLAKIYLLDHKPAKALAIMRLTRQNNFPGDVLIERNLVEARIVTELGNFKEAEVLIDGQNGPEADALRADIFWGSQNWTQVNTVIAKILDNRWQSDAPLTDDERQYLIRQAIALSLLDRRADLALIKQRYATLMQKGLLANAFDVITNPEKSTSQELRDVVRQTASVSTLKSFMNSYRNEFMNSATQTQAQTGG